jgi:vitamin B12 transporter
LSGHRATRRGLAALALSLFRLARAGDGDERTVDLPEIVVPLPRGQAEADPTAAATVVDAARFEGEAKSVGELVSTSPGVAISDYGGLGRLTTVAIRGASSDAVKVLLDGMPLNTAAGGGVDLSTIPRQWISRIEVVRGAEGAHYGSGALGGVVNVVTRPAVAGTWSAQAMGGSFLTLSASGDAAVGGERWAAMAALTLDTTDGRFRYLFDDRPSLPGNPLVPRWRDHDAARLGGLLLKGWALAGNGRIDALAQVSGGWRELPGYPYAETPDDLQEDGRAALALRDSHPLAPGVSLSTEIAGRYDRLDARLAVLSGTARQRDLAGSARAELAWTHGAGTLAVAASAGAERLTATGLGEPRFRPEVAAWISEDLALAAGRLRIAPALRAERAGPYGGLSGKIGATCSIAGPLAIRASGGRTFRAPSFAELYLQQGVLEPNPDLQPEEAWSGDAALVADGALGYASLGAFASLYRDLIVYEPGSFQRLKPFNDGKALVRGLEAELASVPLPALLGLSVSAAYTLLATENLRGSAATLGEDLPHRPRHRLYARLAVEPGAWGAHADALYVGRQWQDGQQLLPIPAALTFGAGAFVRLSRRPDLRLFLEVKNLADDETLQNGFGYPLPGRTVLFTLRAGSPSQEG